jgi:hypothetical protein
MLVAPQRYPRAMANTALRTRSATSPLARAVWDRLAAVPTGAPARSRPLSPAAVRVERTRSQGNGRRSSQSAVTVWFGQGPSLPAPGGSESLRSAMRIGTGVLGAAALAAMSVIAARREESRARVVDAPLPAIPRD